MTAEPQIAWLESLCLLESLPDSIPSFRRCNSWIRQSVRRSF